MNNKQHVLITGGAKGIGEACVRLFLRDGYKVSFLDTDEKSGNELMAELGDSSFFMPCDVSKTEAVKNCFKQAIQKFGQLDVLVNNVGVNIYASVTDTSDELWDHMMNVNLKSHFICSREAIPSMLKKGKGVVIIVTSVQAYISQQNVAAYTTTKSALLGLTRSIAVDYSPEIRSLAICPGTIDTPMLQTAIQESPDPQAVLDECNEMHLSKRVGTANEVAELIVFACSGKVDFMTGQSIRIDGGLGISIGGSKREE